ncbi:MAG: 4a-hydroxytetrahydrobiopterin dehydratase [Actinomycetales bacterium]
MTSEPSLSDLPKWTIDGHALVRSDSAPTFPAAIGWVVAVAQVAETMHHHPDIDIRYRQVTWRLTTHSTGAITELDVDLAHQIDRIVNP